jgi:hypothetical protein
MHAAGQLPGLPGEGADHAGLPARHHRHLALPAAALRRRRAARRPRLRVPTLSALWPLMPRPNAFSQRLFPTVCVVWRFFLAPARTARREAGWGVLTARARVVKTLRRSMLGLVECDGSTWLGFRATAQVGAVLPMTTTCRNSRQRSPGNVAAQKVTGSPDGDGMIAGCVCARPGGGGCCVGAQTGRGAVQAAARGAGATSGAQGGAAAPAGAHTLDMCLVIQNRISD